MALRPTKSREKLDALDGTGASTCQFQAKLGPAAWKPCIRAGSLLALMMVWIPLAHVAEISAVQTANGAVFAWTHFAGPATNSSMVGWQFQASGPNLTVSALVFFDSGGDGLGSAHQVGIWDNNGNLLAQINIPSGTAASLAGDYMNRFLPSSSLRAIPMCWAPWCRPTMRTP